MSPIKNFRNIFILFVVALFVIVACAPAPTPTTVPTSTSVPTAVAIVTATNTTEPTATWTLTPTNNATATPTCRILPSATISTELLTTSFKSQTILVDPHLVIEHQPNSEIKSDSRALAAKAWGLTEEDFLPSRLSENGARVLQLLMGMASVNNVIGFFHFDNLRGMENVYFFAFKPAQEYFEHGKRDFPGEPKGVILEYGTIINVMGSYQDEMLVTFTNPVREEANEQWIFFGRILKSEFEKFFVAQEYHYEQSRDVITNCE